jgi:tetratricopeptide (TPR) repeat protein
VPSGRGVLESLKAQQPAEILLQGGLILAQSHPVKFSRSQAAHLLPFALFAAILLLRLVSLAQLSGSPLLFPSNGDMSFYNDWARRILHGAGGERLAFYGLPGYAYLLAAIYELFGYNPFTPALLQICADAGTGVLIYKISLRLFAPLPPEARTKQAQCIGLVAGACWAFFEPAQAYSVVLMPTALAAFVFWFVVWQLLKRDEFPRLPWFFVLGLLIGLSATAIATLLFLLPLLIAAAVCKWRAIPAARRIASIALLLLAAGIGTAPCWIHNYFYAHDPVFLSAHSGVNFWIGNNPSATGYPNFPPGLHAGQQSMLKDSIAAAERAAGHPLKRAEVSAYWSAQAKAYIRLHFFEWLRLLAIKIGNFWNAFQYDDLSLVTTLRQQAIVLPGLRYGLVAVFALAGGVFALWNFPRARWVAGAILLQLCALLPVFITERYRLPAVPGLLIFASYGVWFFADSVRHVRTRRLIAFGVVIAGATLFVARPRTDGSLWALDAYNSGIVALDVQNLPLASKDLELAYRYSSENAEVNFAMGNLRLAQGERTEAKAYYLRTIQIDPAHGRAFKNLGVLALEEQRWELARAFLAHALRGDARNATTHFLLAKACAFEGAMGCARAELHTALELNGQQPEFIAFGKQLAQQREQPHAAPAQLAGSHCEPAR